MIDIKTLQLENNSCTNCFKNVYNTNKKDYKRNKRRIKEEINKALRSKELSTKLEGETAYAIRDKVICFRKVINVEKQTIGEIDIETNKYIIEVFNGKNSKTTKLFEKYFNENKKYMNPESKQIILYAPNMKVNKILDFEVLGIVVIQNIDNLKRMVGVK